MVKVKQVEQVTLPGVSNAVQIQRLTSGRLFVITPFNRDLLATMKGVRGHRVRILPPHPHAAEGWGLSEASLCEIPGVRKVEATLPDGRTLLHVAKAARLEDELGKFGFGKLGFGWTVAANRADDLAVILHQFWPVDLPAEKESREAAEGQASRDQAARRQAQKSAIEAKAVADAVEAPTIAALFEDLNPDVTVSVATDGRGITVSHPYADSAPGREAGGRWNPTYKTWTGIPFSNAPALAARLREVFGTRNEAYDRKMAARAALRELHAQQLPSSDKPRVPVVGLNRNQYEGKCGSCGKLVDPGKGLVEAHQVFDEDSDQDYNGDPGLYAPTRWETTCATCSWRHAYGLPADAMVVFGWVDLGLTGPDVRLIIRAGHDLAEAQTLLETHGGLSDELRLILGVEAAINE